MNKGRHFDRMILRCYCGAGSQDLVIEPNEIGVSDTVAAAWETE